MTKPLNTPKAEAAAQAAAGKSAAEILAEMQLRKEIEKTEVAQAQAVVSSEDKVTKLPDGTELKHRERIFANGTVLTEFGDY
jgi:hypothetical protein